MNHHAKKGGTYALDKRI